MHFCDKNNNKIVSFVILVVFLLLLVKSIKCQIINRAPQFVPGSGDMSRFSLSENTPVGSPIYQLRGIYVACFYS